MADNHHGFFHKLVVTISAAKDEVKLSTQQFVQQFDVVPQFWQFLKGLSLDDLIIELIQNELDANATRTQIVFHPDRLVCRGDGEPVAEDGWRRLSYVMGAGDQVESKRFRIGVKNHGLKACFGLGDSIILRSAGHKTVQTLYKDGPDGEPSPGTFPSPVTDEEAPSIGCSVEVPYRTKKLRVAQGEPFGLEPVDQVVVERLFREASERLPERLMGIVYPGIRDQYNLSLSHHTLGTVDFCWRVKRQQKKNTKHGKRFTIFNRECAVSSNTTRVQSGLIHEQACTFRLSFPEGARPEVPEFFDPNNRSFRAEVAWLTDKRGKPKAARGVRRYPIGYDATSESALTKFGVHFSGPYRSDAERHGISGQDSLNDYIDEACRDALVDIMASYLLHRHGGKAMELYVAHDRPDDEALHDIIKRTLNRRAIPLQRPLRADKANSKSSDTRARATTRSRIPLGPRRSPSGGGKRIVLPLFTWCKEEFSPTLSEICPKNEDQVSKTVPVPVLRCLAGHDFGGVVITYDENDAIERLQPQQEARFFPWKDEPEWRTALSNPSVARKYLDVVYAAILKGKVEDEHSVKANAYLPDANSEPRPLGELFSAAILPPGLRDGDLAPILHPELREHRLLQRRVWKPKAFTIDDYLNKAQLDAASLETRKSFWRWLSAHWKGLNSRTRHSIALLPVWPSTSGRLHRFYDLCEPVNSRAASIIGGAIERPSPEIFRARLVNKTGGGTFTIRRVPTTQEIQRYLSARVGSFPRDRPLTSDERRDFHQFENDLTILASAPQLKGSLAALAKDAVALAGDLNLKAPCELLRCEGPLSLLQLPVRHVIDRPKKDLDRVPGWAPRSSPTTNQIEDALRGDGARADAHVPRLQEYVRQAKKEGIPPNEIQELPCIPLNGKLYSPGQLALRGQQNYWGGWKTDMPLTGMNAEVQRLYIQVGVVSGVPDSANSRLFFRWLSSQNRETIAKHVDQILRHIGHKSGPCIWSDTSPQIPFIPVECYDQGVRLVTRSDANNRRPRVVIPDFGPLADQIRQCSRNRPVDLAVVKSQKVTEPISAELRDFGLQTLNDFAGEPVCVVGDGDISSTSNLESKRVIASLRSGARGQQLPKRLDSLGLDIRQNKLKGRWHDRLSNIKKVKTAESVVATYRLSHQAFQVMEDGKLDRESGTLWLRSDSDLEERFFDVIADHIFENPQKYLGSVLRRAYKMDWRDRNPTYLAEGFGSPDDSYENEAKDRDYEIENLSGTSGVHPIPKLDPSKNIPKPGPIPIRPSTSNRTSKTGRTSPSRSQPEDESAQIEDLKENQYAWHCQVCLSATEPKVLSPASSYVSLHQNRRQIMHAHHCDHVNAGGARHAGNILVLCSYHHAAIGDAISRDEVTRSFNSMTDRVLGFTSDDGSHYDIEGKLIEVHVPQRSAPVPLFFTTQHVGYWQKMA